MGVTLTKEDSQSMYAISSYQTIGKSAWLSTILITLKVGVYNVSWNQVMLCGNKYSNIAVSLVLNNEEK